MAQPWIATDGSSLSLRRPHGWRRGRSPRSSLRILAVSIPRLFNARARDIGDDDDDDDDSDSVDKGNETSRSRSTENARSRSLKFFLHAKFLAIIFRFNTCPEFSL
jgi:hypothetical protein